MSSEISPGERQIIDTVLEAICTATYGMRHSLFRRAYGNSVICGYTGWGWALLGRG